MTTAAVPQANTSVISPQATPSRHSSMENLRSSTSVPGLLGELDDRRAGDALQDRAGLRGDDVAVGVDEVHVHPAELLDVRALGGVEEDHLVAALGDRLLLGDQRAGVVAARSSPRPCHRGRRGCTPR